MTYSERLACDVVTDEIAADPGSSLRLATTSAHRAKLRELFAKILDLDITRFESAPTAALVEELEPRTQDVLAGANALFGELVETYESTASFAEEPPSGGFPIPFDDGSAYESGVADLAFMAQVELRHRVERLRMLSNAEGVLLAECDGALRRVTRALGAIDRALAGSEDRSSIVFHPDLDHSLRIRRAYAMFRRRVLELDSRGGAIRARLLATGSEIATLVGLPFYPFLRLGDRLHLRALQQRLIGMLRVPLVDEVEGQRLWSDIVSFACMLTQVNRRQELFEHDSRIVIRVVDSLSHLGSITPEMAAELQRLEGRDEDVDTLLDSGRRDLDTWAPVLTRLAHELGRTRNEEEP